MKKNKRSDIFLLIFTLAICISAGYLVIPFITTFFTHEASVNWLSLNNPSPLDGKLADLCRDDIDNDGDGRVDCDDDDCCRVPLCWPTCGGGPDCPDADWVTN